MADGKENWGLMNDFLGSLIQNQMENKTSESGELDDEKLRKMADDLTRVVYPIYESFLDRGADEDVALNLTIGLMEMFRQR